MSYKAWVYIGLVLIGGSLATVATLSTPAALASDATTLVPFAVMLVLATAIQLFKARGPSHEAWHPNLVLLFASIHLLPPQHYVLVVAIPHLVEWAKERLLRSRSLRAWYIQPFNIAMHIIAGLAARALITEVAHGDMRSGLGVLTACMAAVAYLLINHGLVAGALVLARGIPWRETGILDVENLLTDFIMLILGYVNAALWSLSPWLIVPGLSPLVVIYQALAIPQLKREAQTDPKTGLWNARYFVKQFTNELERARRFQRNLSVIMADLDLLRNINNTYGHLAGDAVLAGVGRIIRETIRDYDIAGRFGGEEFCIALPETGPNEAREIAERLRRAVEATEFDIGEGRPPIHATMSLGVASCPWDGTTVTELIHEADVAVYQAKLRGRNCVVTASDVPHFVKLESSLPEDRLDGSYAAAFASRPRLHGNGHSPHVEAQEFEAEREEKGKADVPADTVPRPLLTRVFVASAISLAAIVTAAGVMYQSPVHVQTLLLYGVLAILAELFQVDLYGDGSVSVSVAIAFAAALGAGIPGIAAVSACIALTHFVQRRPPLYKTAFNWATHLLAGVAPVSVIMVQGLPLDVRRLPLLAVPTLISAAVYFAVDTGMIAAAIGMSEGRSFIRVWRESFRWLGTHYIVLCFLGLFLAIAHEMLGPMGVIVFALPVMMMRYAQKQYIDRTEDSIRELRRLNLELANANREIIAASKAIQQLNEELFLTVAKIIDARDPYVSGHAAKVADYAAAIARELRLPADRVDVIRQAAFLHDIGKIGIPERILHKPGKLTPEEYEFVKSHTVLGAALLETSQTFRHLAPYVRYHHERWDGSGYPEGLKGDQIPLEARILGVCDAVEAMASDRPYHHALSAEEIIEELKRQAGRQFDPAIVAAFIAVIEREGMGYLVNSAKELSRIDIKSIIRRHEDAFQHRYVTTFAPEPSA